MGVWSMLVLGHTPCRSGSPHGVMGCFQAFGAVAVLATGCAETVITVAANTMGPIKRCRYLIGRSSRLVQHVFSLTGVSMIQNDYQVRPELEKKTGYFPVFFRNSP